MCYSAGSRGAIRLMKSVPCILLSILFSILPFSCSNDQPQTGLSSIKILVASGINSMDPQLLFEMDSSYVLGNIFDSLVEFDANFKLSPGLAKRWTNPDDHTWRFYLNENARFSDGSPLTASDVLFSIQRVQSLPDSELKAFTEEIESVVRVDDHTVDIKTTTPFSILNNLVFIPIMSEEHVKKVGSKVSDSPLGSGPYKLTARELGKRIVLTVNEHYTPRPSVERIEFLVLEDVEKVLDEVFSMKPDLTLTLPFRKIEEFEKKKPGDLRLLASSGITVEYLIFNLRDSVSGVEGKNPLTDLRVRKALQLGLDREEIIRSIFKGYGRKATQLIAPEIFGFDPSLPLTGPDSEQAKKLLKEAGHENLELTLYSLEGGTYRFENMLIQQWEKIGVKATLKLWKNVPEMTNALEKGEFDIAFSGYVCTSGDAGELLTFGLHTRDEKGAYGSGNYAGYSNSEMDRIVERNLQVLDPKVRLEMLQHAMRLVADDIPYVPILVYDDVYIVSDRIQWTPPVSGEIKAKNIKMVAAAKHR